MKKLWFLLALLFMVSLTFAQDDEDEDEGYEVIEDDFDIDTIDFDIDEIEEDELGKESTFPWKKFTVGGQIGNLSFGDVTNIGISPEITYAALPWAQIGVGGVYEYYKQKERTFLTSIGIRTTPAFKGETTGFRTFARFTPIKFIFGQTEFERLKIDQPYARNNDGTIANYQESLNNVNLGLGYGAGGNTSAGYYVLLLYNAANKSNRDNFVDATGAPKDYYPYNALNVRGGINFPLGQGNKNKKKKDKNKKRKDKEESKEDKKVEN